MTGGEAARIWAALCRLLAAGEPWSFDFFAHLDRVRRLSADPQHPLPRKRVLLVVEQPADRERASCHRTF